MQYDDCIYQHKCHGGIQKGKAVQLTRTNIPIINVNERENLITFEMFLRSLFCNTQKRRMIFVQYIDRIN